jgi:leader peptidase (prepilin peptidase)/N-methyltransferase
LDDLTPLARAAVGGGLGLIAGSFLSTLVVRWPQGRSIAAGRSACDRCGATLSPFELVPLASYAIARGRCRHCGGAIDWRHPASEAAAALIGAASLGLHGGADGLAGAIFGWMLLALFLLDLGWLWLPDRLTLPLAALGLAAGVTGLWPSLQDRLIGAAAGFLALGGIATVYRIARGRDGIGQGDFKLFGAIGAWLGWRALPVVLLAASLLGIAVVLARLAARRPVGATDALPLGAFLAVVAWPVWLLW